MQLAVLLGSRKSPCTRIMCFPGIDTFIMASFDPGCLCDLITCQESGWTQSWNLSTPGAEVGKLPQVRGQPGPHPLNLGAWDEGAVIGTASQNKTN